MARFDQQAHDGLVITLARRIHSTFGEKLLALDYPGHAKPDTIRHPLSGEQHRPDLVATHGFKTYMIEVETSSSINDAHTTSQWQAFSYWARQGLGRGFIVAVPRGQGQAALIRLAQLRIGNAKVIEV